MAQALGIFSAASGLFASTLGLVNFGPGTFRGASFQSSASESNPSTIWIAAGIDAGGGTPGFGDAGGIMPDARVYDQNGSFLGMSIHNEGVWPGDTNHIVVPQKNPELGHYTLFSGNRKSSKDGSDNAVCIAWATIHWPSKGSEHAWSGGWGRACEDWGAQWYYSGIKIPGSDDHTPDCLWVFNWDQKEDDYPPGTDGTNPPVQGFHVNWVDMKIGKDDPRLNTSAKAMCDSRSFRLYKYPDPQSLDLREGELGRRPDIFPKSRTMTAEKSTTEPTSESNTEPTAPPAPGLNKRQLHAEPNKQQPQSPSQPAPPSRQRRTTPDRFANALVINDHARQTAEGLCRSRGSLGPSFADARGRMYCDMETKTLHPFCDEGGDGVTGGRTARGEGGQDKDDKPCFDFGGSNMLRGPGVQKRQAPRVQDWRVRRRQSGL